MHASALVYCAVLFFHRVLTEAADDEEDGARIVGGFETTIDEHPHQVSIRFKKRHKCGGSIISEYWIVTAAHCFQRGSEDDFTIKAGSTRLYGDDGVEIETARIIIHERYSRLGMDFDIALMELKEPLVYGSKIQPIELASGRLHDEERGRREATVTGWGRTSEGGSASGRLREVAVPVLSNADCARVYGARRISPRMICAGHIGTGGKDACQGDSGGPLVQDESLIGIVSWGVGCAGAYPGVYTRVTALRSWISENTDV